MEDHHLGFSIANMDPAVNPGRDFYRFAAGGWLDRAEIPDTESQVNGFIRLYRRVNEQLLTLLQAASAAAATAPKGSIEQQVGDFYASAMDTEQLEARGMAPLQAELTRIDAVDSPASFARTLAYLTGITGAPMLVLPVVFTDKRQNSLNVLQVYPGAFSLGNRDIYLNEGFAPLRAAFQQHIAEMLLLAGVEAEDAARQAATVLELETALAEVKLSPVETANPAATYNKMSVAELLALMPSFDMAAMLEALGVAGEREVIVAEPRYITGLDKLLAARPLDDFKTYLRWRTINALSQYLPPAVAEKNLAFFMRNLQGATQLLPREQRVASQTQHSLGHPVARLYLKRHFDDDIRPRVTEMVGHIKATFDARLRANPWLDEPTRAAALEKLARLEIKVAYPDTWIDTTPVDIRRDDYIGNAMRLNQFELGRNLARAGKPVVDDEFSIPGATLPTDVNAGYQPQANKIEICAAFLQPPFFCPDLDPAVNYGTLGAVIGHEMTHGFDSIGRHFDASGNMTDWWTGNDSADFEALAGKLVKQFSSYEALPGVFVNGELTVTENTADLGGVTLAYHALKASQPGAEKIDGYSPQERFFIAWAQLWMSKERPELQQVLVRSDPHPLGAFRATGPLVNLEGFFDAFGIKPGDGMWRDAEDRVEIW
jgi:putative endopeptidase